MHRGKMEEGSEREYQLLVLETFGNGSVDVCCGF